jgi:peptidylprolyl isomerase
VNVRSAARLLVLALAAQFAAACSQEVAARPADDETKKPAAPAAPAPATPAEPAPEAKIEVMAKGEGREVKPNDFVLAHLTARLASTLAVLVDTRAEGEPQPFIVGSGGLMPALETALSKMRVGDRWKVSAPYQLAWGERGYPGIVPPRADVILDVEVVGFLDLAAEVLKTGAGALPVPGEYVVLHYVGTLPEGTVVDDTRKDGVAAVVTLGAGQAIQGVELALRKMRPGDRVKVRIPWQLAYGTAGRPPAIPPKMDVIYDLERLPLPEIRTEVIAAGKGAPCVPGKPVSIHYTGTLPDGTKFDSSRDVGRPYQFVLGARQVIPGWELAVARMRVGDRWKITVPSALAYGAKGEGAIPPKADLVFDLEVLETK